MCDPDLALLLLVTLAMLPDRDRPPHAASLPHLCRQPSQRPVTRYRLRQEPCLAFVMYCQHSTQRVVVMHVTQHGAQQHRSRTARLHQESHHHHHHLYYNTAVEWLLPSVPPLPAIEES
jgi:hypothetical protein